MAEDLDAKEPTPVSGMHGVHLAVMFLITAPVVGWMAGMAWLAFTASNLLIQMQGAFAIISFLMGLAGCILPVLWGWGLLAAWRDLGRDRLWFVRYSPPALAAVLILAAYATVSSIYH